MLPIPLIVAGALMLAGAITADAQQRARRRRLPRTGPDTPEAPAPGDTGWAWPWSSSPEWWALYVTTPGSSGLRHWFGPRQHTASSALDWKLDALETYGGSATRYVWRGGRWQWVG